MQSTLDTHTAGIQDLTSVMSQKANLQDCLDLVRDSSLDLSEKMFEKLDAVDTRLESISSSLSYQLESFKDTYSKFITSNSFNLRDLRDVID